MPRLPKLIVITDWSLGEAVLLSRLEAALSLGPVVGVQHRHPEVKGRQFFAEAQHVAQLARRHGNPLFINSRLDVALLLGGHLHLRADDPLASEVRGLLGNTRWISRSVHSRDEVANARGADLALVSPVFSPTSKHLDLRAPLLADGFFRLSSELSVPSFALGGIDSRTAKLLPGAVGVAVVGSVLHAEDPFSAASEILRAQ